MTVKELIEQLKKLGPETMVVMSKEGEGNSFSPLSEVEAGCKYVSENGWRGEITDPDNPDGVPAVILWPTN